jgi:beta-glucanase (GH16 family)
MRDSPNAAVRRTFYALALALLFGAGLTYAVSHEQGKPVAAHRVEDRASRTMTRRTPAGTPTTSTAAVTPTATSAPTATPEVVTSSPTRPTSNVLFRDDFGSLSNWARYDSPGHAGQGLRSPAQISVSDGICTIVGTADGTTGGMSLPDHDLKYGKVEVRLRTPKGAGKYHPVALLWPSSENWPSDGEVDFVEIWNRPLRDRNDFNLHYGASNNVLNKSVAVDATQWHTYSTTWTATYLSAAVDGVEYFRTTNVGALPPNVMHVALQLDWFPFENSTSGAASMQIDWVQISRV